MLKLNKISNNLKIIVGFSVCAFLAGLYLFVVEAKNHDNQYNKQWSIVYFISPNESNLNFAIENYENEPVTYTYQITTPSGELKEENKVSLEAGEKKEIMVDKTLTQGVLTVSYKDQFWTLTR